MSAAQLEYCGRHARHYRIAMLRAACLLAFRLGRNRVSIFVKNAIKTCKRAAEGW